VILAADWVTISALATAAGTLVLATATFASVRSANRAARVAERSLLAGLRPLLVPSRLDDPPQKVGFADGRWFSVTGSHGIAEVGDEAIYLVMSVRNAASGVAVQHGWYLHTSLEYGPMEHRPLGDFHRLTRDLFLAAGETGFWQGTFREPGTPEFDAAREAIEARRRLGIEVLYGDLEGGQRTISLFALNPGSDAGWLVSVARHWSIDRPEPR
jgi:hypothetical protein